jgi:hypothetical protein
MKKKLAPLFLLAACSAQEPPDLPDLNRQSFSEDEILQKCDELTKKAKVLDSETDGI